MAQRTCPDCRRPLRRIRILDQLSGGASKSGLAYTDGAAPKHAAWSGDVKNAEGRIQAHVCDGCQRVSLYAEPV